MAKCELCTNPMEQTRVKHHVHLGGFECNYCKGLCRPGATIYCCAHCPYIVCSQCKQNEKFALSITRGILAKTPAGEYVRDFDMVWAMVNGNWAALDPDALVQTAAKAGAQLAATTALQAGTSYVAAETGKAALATAAAKVATLGVGRGAVVAVDTAAVVAARGACAGAGGIAGAAAGPAGWASLAGQLVGAPAGELIGHACGGDEGAQVGKEVGGAGGAIGAGAIAGACVGGPVGAAAGAGIGLVGYGISKGVDAIFAGVW